MVLSILCIEIINGLDPNNSSDALLDADNDGRSNLIEYFDGGAINIADTGDANGDGLLDIADLLLLQRHLIGAIVLDFQAASRSDFNSDQLLDVTDLLRLEQALQQ